MAVELITNGNFAADITGWTRDVGGLSWQNAVSGDGSTGFMRVAIAANPNWDRFWQSCGLTGNKAYRCTFWYRTSAGITGNQRVYVCSEPIYFVNALVVGPALTPTTSWAFMSFTFSTNGVSHPYWGIYKNGNVGAGDADFDAISVQLLEGSYMYRAQQ